MKNWKFGAWARSLMQNEENLIFWKNWKNTKPPSTSFPSHFVNLAEEGELCNSSHGSQGGFRQQQECSSVQPFSWSHLQAIEQVTHHPFSNEPWKILLVWHGEVVNFLSNWDLFGCFKCGNSAGSELRVAGCWVFLECMFEKCKGEGIRTPLGHSAQASKAPLEFKGLWSYQLELPSLGMSLRSLVF